MTNARPHVKHFLGHCVKLGNLSASSTQWGLAEAAGICAVPRFSGIVGASNEMTGRLIDRNPRPIHSIASAAGTKLVQTPSNHALIGMNPSTIGMNPSSFGINGCSIYLNGASNGRNARRRFKSARIINALRKHLRKNADVPRCCAGDLRNSPGASAWAFL